jgi:hypothetical protein
VYVAQKAATSTPSLGFGRIAKPLRGGGGGPTIGTGSVLAPISGGGASNQLNKLQSEEGGYVTKSYKMITKYKPGVCFNSSNGELFYCLVMWYGLT